MHLSNFFQHLLMTGSLSAALTAMAQSESLPTISVARDDTRIDRNCRIVIPPGTIIADANQDGVIHIVADDIEVEFAPGSELRGADQRVPGDTLTGIGIRIDGRRGATVRNARVHGYKCGLLAAQADSLTVDGGDYSGNFRQHLRSTPAAEESSDWLFPHAPARRQLAVSHAER